MSRSDQERFADIIDAVERCQQYAPYLHTEEHTAMAYDAILRNLAVIGEAVRALSSETRARNPDVPWAAIAGLRNVVVHEYFRINPELILDIVDNQLTPLKDQLQSQ
ncbi:MAG: HepT-like ribonuclease domain-containing protein [Dermatophilaceae bacterium]